MDRCYGVLSKQSVLFIDREVENPRATEKLAERFHDFRHAGKNDLVHRFRLPLEA